MTEKIKIANIFFHRVEGTNQEIKTRLGKLHDRMWNKLLEYRKGENLSRTDERKDSDKMEHDTFVDLLDDLLSTKPSFRTPAKEAETQESPEIEQKQSRKKTKKTTTKNTKKPDFVVPSLNTKRKIEDTTGNRRSGRQTKPSQRYEYDYGIKPTSTQTGNKKQRRK